MTERSADMAGAESSSAGAERRRTRLLAGAVAGVALLAYANAIPNGFVFDDDEQILQNVWLTDFRYLGTLFTSNVWGFQPGTVSNYYRPLMHAVYLVLFQVFGAKPWPFHLLNVLLHAATSALVFLIANRLLRGREDEPVPSVAGPGTVELAAFAAGILFAVHTIHTEAVAWIGGLPELAFTFLFLLAFRWEIGGGRRSPWVSAASGGAFFAALLFKETAVVLIPLLMTHDLLRSRPPSVRDRLRTYVPLLAAFAAYSVLRTGAIGGLVRLQPFEPYGALAPSAYAANALYLFARYLAALLVPVGLNVTRAFPVLRSVLEPLALFGGAVSLVAGALTIVTWKRAPRACFALLVAFLPLLPALLVPRYSVVPFGERYLYLPSVGLSLLVALGIVTADRAGRFQLGVIAALLVVLGGGLLAGTVIRNRVWRDDVTLFSDAVAKSPESEIANTVLGRALLSKGRFDEAVVCFQKASRVAPDRPMLRYQLGSALLKAGRAQEAIPEFEKVLAKLAVPEALSALAEAYSSVGRFDEAIARREHLVRAYPDRPAERNLLGIDLARASRYEEAIGQFEAAVRLDPGEPAYRRNLDRARRKLLGSGD